jgi:antitoxin component YwqK of YwqJK toxin-antitoxin module
MTRPTKFLIHKSVKRAILLLIITLNNFVGFSQKFEIENKFHIKQDDKSIIFRVLDTDESHLKKYDSKKNYYWFKSQKILITQGGSSGSLLNGDYESFYKNNQLAEKGLFKKGLKHGIWRFWGQNGILIHQENWSSGIQIGKQLYYSDQGILEKTILYKSNQVQIIARDTTIVKTKKTVLTTVKDSVGKLIMQSRFKSGQLDGTQINRDQNDSLIKTVYKNGELITKKTKAEKGSSEKKTFKEKMTNFWEKLKFWKKFKKKGEKAMPSKTESSSKKDQKPKEKKEKAPKEVSQPKEKKTRKE